MSLSRTLTAVGAAALISAMLVGCGSENTLTAKEFRSQANKLCAAEDKDTDSYGANISETSTDAEVTEAIQKSVKRETQLVASIEALKVPKELADDVDSLLDSVRAGNKAMAKISSVQDLTSLEPGGPFKDATAKAKELGLDACAD